MSHADTIDLSLLAEFECFMKKFPKLDQFYLPVGKIGEGTFSTVYKAIDLNFSRYDNQPWLGCSNQDRDQRKEVEKYRHLLENCDQVYNYPQVRASGLDKESSKNWRHSLEKFFNEYDRALASQSNRNGPPCNEAGRSRKRNSHAVKESNNGSNKSQLSEKLNRNLELHFVALKRINMTSSPDRILDEISFLKTLGGSLHIVPIITVHRYEDQIVVVLPYFRHQDFREYLFVMTIDQIKDYMKALFEAVAHVHDHYIIHRDIKPSNFLYCTDVKRGLLVDFGLAQIYEEGREEQTKMDENTPTPSNTTNSNNNLLSSRIQTSSTHRMTTRRSGYPSGGMKMEIGSLNKSLTRTPGPQHREGGSQLRPGYYAHDVRPNFKASRAGTRGFRAPEVLFKCAMQTPAIDIWSVGVIFLTLLTRHYPFFNSPDDMEAIVEIACIFGRKAMAAVATKYERIFMCNAESVGDAPIPWKKLCHALNPELEPHIPDSAYDLLGKCLALHSHERITAREALLHPFMTS